MLHNNWNLEAKKGMEVALKKSLFHEKMEFFRSKSRNETLSLLLNKKRFRLSGDPLPNDQVPLISSFI